MMLCKRRRTRTICLSLAGITIFLHLFLALLSLSINHQPCDPPPITTTHTPNDLARTFSKPAGMEALADPPPGAAQQDASNKNGDDESKGLELNASTASAVQGRTGHNLDNNSRAEPLESGLEKLKALFGHPLYNLLSFSVSEDDVLLKGKPKVKAVEESPQMWVSVSQEDYENEPWNSSSSTHPPWLRFHLGISRWQLYGQPDPNVEAVMQQLATERIVSAVQKSGGTQLKLVMSFPNYGQALLKPMKQERNDETNYNLYYFSDFERHNAEIAAFHLDRILGYRRVPPVVGRLVDVMKEIKNITTDRKLARTFFTSPVGNVCFYGQCSYYCSTEHAVCGRPMKLEVSLAVMLPDLSLATRRSWRSPWRRSYSRSRKANWETDPHYCSKVRQTSPYDKGTRLVDVMDMVILDYLMKHPSKLIKAREKIYGVQNQIGSMEAVSAVERPNDQIRGKDKTRSGKTNTPEVTLPPLCPKPSLSTVGIPRSVVRHPRVIRDGSSERTSVLQLPPLNSQGLTRTKTTWCQGPGTMVSALRTDSLVTSAPEVTAKSFTKKHALRGESSGQERLSSWKAEKGITTTKMLLTGTDVLQIFAQEKQQVDCQHYFLKIVHDNRPYDLQVVDWTKAGPEHYIFSQYSVLHVTEKGCNGFVSLSEWHRESMLWRALQEITFFRNFRLRKSFTCWQGCVQKLRFHRRCEGLRDQLLISVPLFRDALYLFFSFIEDVKETHLLPLRELQSCTLPDFRAALNVKSKECVKILKKFSDYRTGILLKVRKDAYKKHQELQMHLQYTKNPTKCFKPIHLQLAHQQELKRQVVHSKSILQKLGNFGCLINQMTLQSMATLISRDVVSFLKCPLKNENPQQCSLFQTNMSYKDQSLLSVDPPVHLFKKAVSEVLVTAVDYIVETCERCGMFLEISSSETLLDLSAALCGVEPLTVKELPTNAEGSSGCKNLCSWQMLRDVSAHLLLLPKQNQLMMQGNVVQSCYPPLSKKQLERQIRNSDPLKQAETELVKSMKAAETEIQLICEEYKWLVHINAFINKWSSGSMESLTHQPASQFEEDLIKICHWIERLNSIPSTISTCTKMFIIHCTNAKETLENQLKNIKNELLERLVMQIKLHSKSFISDIEMIKDELLTDPRDVHVLSTYAQRIVPSLEKVPDMHTRLEYIHSLQDIVCRYYRAMTEQECMVKDKMMCLWESFVPLLSDAVTVIRRHLPSAVHALDTVVLLMSRELENALSKVSSGPFLDPTQNTEEVVTKLDKICLNVDEQYVNLKQGCAVDFNGLTRNIEKATTCNDLWELRAVITKWSEEWKQLLLTQVQVSEARQKIILWKEKAHSLTSIVAAHDAVLQETFQDLESYSNLLAVMAKLQSPTLRHKHWRTISKVLELPYNPEKEFTVNELMVKNLDVHQKIITQICTDAEGEFNMEKNFLKLQQGWKTRLLELDVFTQLVWQQLRVAELQKSIEGIELQVSHGTSCNEARFVITGFETCFAEIENDLMSLSVMLTSQYSLEIREKMEDWVQSLHYLEKLLDLFERYQQLWTYLTMIFDGTFSTVQKENLLEEFKPVDMTFKEVMQTLSTDPHVLNLLDVSGASGSDLYNILINGLSIMDRISSQMTDALDAPRDQFPRLWFLSGKDLIHLLVCHPPPSIFQFFVRKCFEGIHILDFKDGIKRNAQKTNGDQSGGGQIHVWGFFSLLEEHICFISPLKQNVSVPVWLREFETTLSSTMRHLLNQCYSAMNKLQESRDNVHVVGEKLDGQRKDAQHLLDLLADFPLQCVLLAKEAKWCSDVLQSFRETSAVKLSTLKESNAEELKSLCLSIRTKAARSHPPISNYILVCLGALISLTMNHARQLSQLMDVQGQPESSFEWLSLLKYHISPERHIVKDSDGSLCQVNVFGYKFQYGFEYSGPEDCVMVHTPATDRAVLGILLALTSYRCGHVTGPSMSGKTKTVLQLGKALGRQVVHIQCSPPMSHEVLQQMLSGALQTGAWLLLDSVDLLTSKVLSTVGQNLLDIHQTFCSLAQVSSQRSTEEQKKTTVASKVDYIRFDFAGKKVSAHPNYGCVLISSKECTSNLSETLRFVTRPVVLIHPDYRIIAEVMLTSFGFSDAVSLSQRLVTFISLLKDSFCLPGFITQHHSSHLITLQKIISVSGKYLKERLREQDILNEDSEKNNSVYFKNASGIGPEKAYDKSDYAPRSCSSCFIKQSLMEETAVVKAILSVLIPGVYDPKKASQFNAILRDSFPLVSQFPLSQQQDNQLRDAITRELQLRGFYPDPQIICSTLTLHQTIQFSQTVLLIGPSGSGKTTSYSSLAGAVSSLAATSSGHMMDSQTSVRTVVLFPNAMSHDDLFGFFCVKRGWRDGAITKLLRNSDLRSMSHGWNMQKESDHKAAVKWLVMDGEPFGQPSWMDCLTTLTDPQGPFLFLPSGEKLVPSKLHLKLLFEMTDLSELSPSTLSRCSLVHFVGAGVWKSVWKKELKALSCIFKLDQDTLKVWDCLTEDLFSQTLSLLRQRALTSAISGEGSNSATHGLQEILSFVRILSALLQYFQKELEHVDTRQDNRGGIEGIRDIGLHNNCTPDKDGKLLTRNIFLLAYVWGFGGHLHPCHWPQFDLLVRQVLLCCRYKIEIPEVESVLEHFFGIDVKLFPNNTLPSEHRKYSYLLNIMLEAKQPVLLAGECATGKTNLCQSLLHFDRPHIRLRGSPLLSNREFLVILKNISYKRSCKDDAGSLASKSRLLLFVDDLHEARCDSFGKKSTALECLRHSMSQGWVLTFINNHFEFLNSAQLSYMATYCVSGCGHNVLSSRLSRLFSVFVLPSRSAETVFSVHSQRFSLWLEGLELQRSTQEITRCIITATKTLCHAVSEHFQPNAIRPHLIFSHHDLQKVFEGMYLWQPIAPATWSRQSPNALSGCPQSKTDTSASVLHLAHLWMHECMRTFSDRLWSENERTCLVSLVAKVVAEYFGIGLDKLHRVNVPVDVAAAATESCPPTDTKDTCEQTHQDTVATHPKKKDVSVEASPVARNNTDDKNLNNEAIQPPNLQHIETLLLTLAYGPELQEPDGLLEQQHNFRFNSCYVQQDPNVLLKKLSLLIDRNEHNIESDAAKNPDLISRYLLHTDRVKQLLHIQRALLLPGGHGVLMSSEVGTGRKTTVRLASLITGCQLIEIHPGNENKLHDILREAGNQTRIEGSKVIVLVHEEISENVREELLVAMAHRTYPAVYTEEELNNLASRVTAVEMSTRYQMDSWMLDKFLRQVHKNVHVFLLMSDQSNKGNNRQLLKALRLGCCIELYRPWSSQALMEVAAQRLKNKLNDLERESLVECLSETMAGIHHSACHYASVLLQAQPFSPQTYVEFVAHFEFVFNHLKTQYQKRADRVASVISVLDSLNNGALQNKQLVERLTKKVAEAQQCENSLLRAADDQKKKRYETQKNCTVEINRIKELEIQKEQLQGEVRSVFLSAVEILKCLSPSDLEEVRRYRDPPDRVVTVMDAVCLLFDRPLGWDSAKQLLGQSDFFQELEFFDRFSLSKEKLQQLSLLVKSPLFVPESVREVSKACESLCRWVQAVYECCCVQRQLLIKQQLEQQLQEARGRLCLAKQHMADAHRRLGDLKHQLRQVQNDLKQQVMELHKAKDVEREAALTAEQLEEKDAEWRDAAQEVKLHFQNLPGDAVILAAIIAYSGPFACDIRLELIGKWRELCQTGHIDIKPRDPRSSLLTQHESPPPVLHLGFPVSVSEKWQDPVGRALDQKNWHLQNTPGLVVQLLLWGYRNVPAQCCPLLADMQQYQDMQAQSLFITEKKDTEYDLVLYAGDSHLLDKLDEAAHSGLKVLVTHIERAIPSPEFLDRLAPGLQKHPQAAHPRFHLFLSTNMSVRLVNKALHPSVLACVRVVDLSLSSDEIQELMLTQLLQSECRELLIHHKRLQNDKHELRERLAIEEEALIGYILQSKHSEVHLCEFRSHVLFFQEVMKRLQDEMEKVNEELKYHKGLVADLQRLVTLAAALYQTLQELSRLSPVYCFPLRGFIKFVRDTVTVKGRPLVSFITAKVPVGIVSEVTNKMVSRLLIHYRPLLFKNHFAVLKLLVSVAVLGHDHLCSEAERVALIRGLQDVEAPEKNGPDSSASVPSWIPTHIHSELLCLENILLFKGLLSSLSSSPLQWQEYLGSPSSTLVGAVPCRSHSHLSLLQRALLWRIMKPHCLWELADVIAGCHLCLPVETQRSEAPHAGNPHSLLEYMAKHEGPIILTLPSSGGDKLTSTHPLQLIIKLADSVPAAMGTKQKVRFISFGSLFDGEMCVSVLRKAVSEGHWLVFNDCHLLDQWDDEVLSLFHHLCSSVKGQTCPPDPCFRVWFITHEDTVHHIPATLRLCSLTLVCESPWDLKEELSLSLQEVLSVISPRSFPNGDTDKDFLLRCATFHSVLLQRQNCGHLGQGRMYNWNQLDLLALVEAHHSIVRLCHNRTEALCYIAVSLVHGGHVSDSADLEVVENIAERCLSRASPLWSGDEPNNSAQSDLSGLLKIMDQSLKDSANTDDPLLLGFGMDVAAEIIKINNHDLNILLQASQTPQTSDKTLPLQPFVLLGYSQAEDTLQELKNYLTEKKSTITNAGAASPSPLCDFLKAQWDELLDAVVTLLSRLRQPVQYNTETLSSLPRLEDLSYLQRRAELLSSYVTRQYTSDPPGAYRLSAFSNAKGFLVAMMREASQVHRKYVSDITLTFQVANQNTCAVSLLDAVYLCGLELRGASWDHNLGVLKDTVSSQPCTLPPVCIKAEIRSQINVKDDLSSGKSAYLMDKRNFHISEASPSTASELPVYHCPLYLDRKQGAGESGLTAANIITLVPLRTRLNPVLCSLRRVRLVSVL